jgi:ferric-dicitrate binding protein FerR (iron transport regulator)
MQFESTELQRITKRLERFYNIRLEFSHLLLGGLRISGKMELKADKDEILDRIASAAAVKIVKKEEGLYEIIK